MLNCLNHSIAVVLLTVHSPLPTLKISTAAGLAFILFFNSDVKVRELGIFLQSYWGLKHSYFKQNYKNQKNILKGIKMLPNAITHKSKSINIIENLFSVIIITSDKELMGCPSR